MGSWGGDWLLGRIHESLPLGSRPSVFRRLWPWVFNSPLTLLLICIYWKYMALATSILSCVEAQPTALHVLIHGLHWMGGGRHSHGLPPNVMGPLQFMPWLFSAVLVDCVRIVPFPLSDTELAFFLLCVHGISFLFKTLKDYVSSRTCPPLFLLLLDSICTFYPCQQPPGLLTYTTFKVLISLWAQT